MNCILYLPGLGYDHFDISVEAYAQRYAVALDRTHSNKLNRYAVETESIGYGIDNQFESKVATVFEVGVEGEKRLVARIFECQYQKELTENFTQRNLLIRSGMLFWALFKKLPVILYSPKSKSVVKSKKGRFQILYFSVVFLMVALVGLLMVPSTVSLVLESIERFDFTPFASLLPADIRSISLFRYLLDSWQIVSKFIVLVSSLLLFLFPGVMNFIESMAIEFLCLDYYLNYSNNHLNIMGKIEALYERISEQEKYEGIELHGFSFGSVLILDLLFPYSETVNERLKQETTQIVTIGCPFHFIMRYYPQYFNHRKNTKLSSLKKWINVYSEVDVMSSVIQKNNGIQFLNSLPVEVENKDFDVINHKMIGFSDYVMFVGIRAHTMYWGNNRNARSCLTLVHSSAKPPSAEIE